MSKFVITTEDACELPASFYEGKDVKRIHLHYYLDGEERSSENYDAKEFFDRLRSGGKASTSQVNEFEVEEFFRPLLQEGYDILHLAFSSALSGTYNNEVIVAKRLQEEFPERKIYVVDTCSQSGGQGLLVTLVSEYKEKGHSLEECYKYAEEVKHRVVHLFTVNDLRWLIATGRVKKAEAFIGNMLQIKPLLYTSDEGKLTPHTRLVSRKLVLNALCEKAKQKYTGERELIYISHGDCPADAEFVKKKLAPLGAEIVVLDISPIIGCHTGPDVLAIFCTGKDRSM